MKRCQYRVPVSTPPPPKKKTESWKGEQFCSLGCKAGSNLENVFLYLLKLEIIAHFGNYITGNSSPSDSQHVRTPRNRGPLFVLMWGEETKKKAPHLFQYFELLFLFAVFKHRLQKFQRSPLWAAARPTCGNVLWGLRAVAAGRPCQRFKSL